ncbi:hypothetical protein D6825_00550 [Candidatus Woesearchaeota archaeon]|nr:MAG: hypothetical protein D6825_00550 [Candidatus Woesearchaeota archaeon]
MKHTSLITAILLALFASSHAIGLFVISSYVDVQATKESGEVVWKSLPSIAGVELERPDVSPQYSVAYIIAAVIAGTIVILLIARLKTMLLWKAWFAFAVILCMYIAFNAFIPTLSALIAAIVLGLAKVFKPGIYIHNFTELFVYGGLATIFVPILTLKSAYVLLILLSLYDMYAVWHSKHMITLAKFQTASSIFAGLLIPYTSAKTKRKKKTKTRKPSKGTARTAVLGGGDIGFPLIFSGAALVHSGITVAILTSLGATIALALLLSLGRKDRFYPAMPFLTAGCTAGFLLGMILA